MRLIDILNKIANGELKEGTKFVYRRNMYIWKDNMILNTSNLEPFDIADRSDLNMELELIEPEEPTDNTNIEELDIENLCRMLGNSTSEGITAFGITLKKLNEVIRKINKENKNE